MHLDPEFPPPVLEPEPDWRPAPELGIYRRERNFVSGEPEGQRLRVRFWVRDGDAAFVGKVWFGPQAEGPPLCAHGGSIAAVLDDAMGRGVWVAGHMVLAGRISVEFRSRVPLGAVHLVEAVVERAEGRKVHSRGRLLDASGRELASSEGLFVRIDASHFEEERRRLEAMGHPVWEHPGGEGGGA